VCGIIVCPQSSEIHSNSIELLKRRGPDAHRKIAFNGYDFQHFLLSIEGSSQPQPIESERSIVLFNGEIYNFKELSSGDSEVALIQSLYESDGIEGLRGLDGEYAIVIYDKFRDAFIVAMDPFGTKPLFFSSYQSKAHIASYESVLNSLGCENIRHLSPNKIYTISSATGLILGSVHNQIFSLRQFETSFDGWCESFEAAVEKRYRHGKDGQSVYIGLSSGYDSGAIAAALNKLKLKFSAFSIIDEKNSETIQGRASSTEFIHQHLMLRDRRRFADHLTYPVEKFPFRIFSDITGYVERGTSTETDMGARGLAQICDAANRLGFKIYLSGAGADEIYSDYGYGGRAIYSHSNFGGHFPEELSRVFPWASFYGSSMRSYLMKEELVAGYFGQEGRYPFLDRDLVQKFLNLDSSLKNSQYKAPIEYYLRSLGYPFDLNEKLGF
jgi:asparagine synthetase B (glutamine-hydrolysing)